MDEINYVFLFIKISVFFVMMWSLSLFVPKISKGIRDDKKSFGLLILQNKLLFAINVISSISVITLIFYN